MSASGKRAAANLAKKSGKLGPDPARMKDLAKQTKKANIRIRDTEKLGLDSAQAMHPIAMPGLRQEKFVEPISGEPTPAPDGWQSRIVPPAKDGSRLKGPDGKENYFELDNGMVVDLNGNIVGKVSYRGAPADNFDRLTPMQQAERYQALADAIIAATGPGQTVSAFHLNRIRQGLRDIPAEHMGALLRAISPDPEVATERLKKADILAGEHRNTARANVSRANAEVLADAQGRVRTQMDPDTLDDPNAFRPHIYDDLADPTLTKKDLPTKADDQRGRLMQNLTSMGTSPSRHFIHAKEAKDVKAEVQRLAGLPASLEAPPALRKDAYRTGRYERDDKVLRRLRQIQESDMPEAEKQRERLKLADELVRDRVLAGTADQLDVDKDTPGRRIARLSKSVRGYPAQVQTGDGMSATQRMREQMKVLGGYSGPADPVVDVTGDVPDGSQNVDRLGEDPEVGAALSSPEARQAMEDMTESGPSRAGGNGRPNISRRHGAVGGTMAAKPRRGGFSKELRIEGVEVDPRLLPMYAPDNDEAVAAMADKVMEFSDEYNYPGGREDLENRIRQEVRTNGYSPLLHSEDALRSPDISADYPDRTAARDMLRDEYAKVSQERFGNPSVASVAPEDRGPVRQNPLAAAPADTGVSADASSVASTSVGDDAATAAGDGDLERILAKWEASGEDSLTPDERALLDAAAAQNQPAPAAPEATTTEAVQPAAASDAATAVQAATPAKPKAKRSRGKAKTEQVDDGSQQGPKSTQVAPLPGTADAADAADGGLEAALDAILTKRQQVGDAGLSPEERALLEAVAGQPAATDAAPAATAAAPGPTTGASPPSPKTPARTKAGSTRRPAAGQATTAAAPPAPQTAQPAAPAAPAATAPAPTVAATPAPRRRGAAGRRAAPQPTVLDAIARERAMAAARGEAMDDRADAMAAMARDRARFADDVDVEQPMLESNGGVDLETGEPVEYDFDAMRRQREAVEAQDAMDAEPEDMPTAGNAFGAAQRAAATPSPAASPGTNAFGAQQRASQGPAATPPPAGPTPAAAPSPAAATAPPAGQPATPPQAATPAGQPASSMTITSNPSLFSAKNARRIAALAGGSALVAGGVGALRIRPYVPMESEPGMTIQPPGRAEDMIRAAAEGMPEDGGEEGDDMPMTVDRARALLQTIQSNRGRSPRLHTLQSFH